MRGWRGVGRASGGEGGEERMVPWFMSSTGWRADDVSEIEDGDRGDASGVSAASGWRCSAMPFRGTEAGC